MIKAVLLKPLDGDPIGSEREFDKLDFERLRLMGAVRAADAGDAKAAFPVINKVAPPVANKSDVGRSTKG